MHQREVSLQRSSRSTALYRAGEIEFRTGILYSSGGTKMASETTYTSLRANLSAVLDQVVDGREVVVVRRKNGRDVALVPANELQSLMETAHLLRSPRNARRLLGALRRAEKGQGKALSAAQLRREMGLGSKR